MARLIQVLAPMFLTVSVGALIALLRIAEDRGDVVVIWLMINATIVSGVMTVYWIVRAVGGGFRALAGRGNSAPPPFPVNGTDAQFAAASRGGGRDPAPMVALTSPAAADRVCQRCGALSRSGANFCADCGSRML